LRVGFDASVIFSSVGGTSVYAVQLLSAMLDLKPDWTYFLYSRSTDQAEELHKRWSASNVRPIVVEGRPNVWRIQARLPGHLRRDEIDLYHSLGNFLPLAWTGPKVVTIHDLNIYQNWRSWILPGTVLNWADLAFQTPLAIRAADRVITDSQFSKDSICRILRVASDKIAVVPLAPDPFFDSLPTKDERAEAIALTSGEPFVLYVGILSPQKNLGTLIRAFAASGLATAGGRLVLAGSDREGHGAALRATAMSNGVAAQVLLPGFVSRAMLRALYHQARCVVLPSYGEGFGLPLVEAMACGAPVLAANRQSMPEVVGDAGCLFEPHDVNELAALIGRISRDSLFRRGLARRGRTRRRRFSWSSAAEATVAIYESTLSGLR
jgi:glycosyltransferase involved in cell wall biosynthesis